MLSRIYEMSELASVADWVFANAGDEKIWVLQGEMGAGKTTLIKALGEKMGVIDPMSSPTFGIVNQYETDKGERIYHFDFYRLDDPAEALEIGIDEYFYGGDYCWMEWAENLGGLIPDQFLLVKIEYYTDSSRKITLQLIEDVH